MTDFIKICPKCGQQNPEYDNLCSACGHFIGMESPIPRPAARPATAATRRFDPVGTLFYLQSVNGEVYTVQDGWVLGQAHPTNRAQVQIAHSVAGSEYIHRHHCRFDYRNAQWQVTALDQHSQGRAFTNPTFVNQQPVKPGNSQVLANDDTLTLAGVSFVVKFPH